MNYKYIHFTGFLVHLLILCALKSNGEGTAQILLSDAGHGKMQIMSSFSDFGLYNKGEAYRLHVRVANIGEIIYYGFGSRLTNNDAVIPNVYCRITNPSGTVIVVPEALLPTTGQGFINSYTEAVAGPTQIAGAGGYNAKSYTPTELGDYYFEFRYDGTSDRCKFKYFDITVASAANAPIPGRVWSKAWQFTADGNSTTGQEFRFQGKLFVYADDGIVTSIDFNGMAPYVFTVFCNQYGVDPAFNSNWLTNRKSKSNKYYNPQYKIFLLDPDNDLNNPTWTFPTGWAGVIVPPIIMESNCDGTGVFTVNVTKPGKVLLLLDIDPTPGVQPIDVEIPWDAPPYAIPWNGLNGLGQPVPNGTSFPVSVTYLNGLTNLPIYDVEYQLDGYVVKLIRINPPGTTDPSLFWDDSNLSNGTSPPDGCNYGIPPSGCHTWVNAVGNNNSINTWWYAATTSTVATDPFIEKRDPQPLGAISGPENNFCAGSMGKSFSVAADPNSTSYTWTFTGGDYVVHGTSNSVTIDFGPTAVSGNLTVVGNNASCGAGTIPSPAFPITIVPPPVVTVSPSTLDKCSSDPAFLLSGGSPFPGIYKEGGIPITSFDPQTATPGAHTITYTYTTSPPASCSNTADLTINVVNLPSITFNSMPDVCIDQAPVPLTATPAGGTYSGLGVTGTSFDPSVAGPGTHSITYTFTSGSNCTNTESQSITVLELPTITTSTMADVCVDLAPFQLTFASPPGGIYTGPGVTGTDFNPAVAGVNTHTLTYTYTDISGCTNTATQQIVVLALPVITFTALPDICASSSPVTLSGTLPAGGTYSGPGVTGDQFDPSVTGAGTFTITYLYFDGNCTNTANQTIKVNDLPAIIFSSLPDKCFNDAPYTLTSAAPAGGTYSGAGVTGGVFNPGMAGNGNHPILYTYTDPLTNCVNTSSKDTQVNPLPFLDFTGPVLPATVCQDAASPSVFQIGADPLTTFTWSIPALYASKGNIAPVPGFPNMAEAAWSGIGAAQVQLDGLTNKGCSDSRTKNVLINPKPEVSIIPCFDQITNRSAKPFLLKGGRPLLTATPNQGEYLATPSTPALYPDAAGNYYFNPSQALAPSYQISYRYTSDQYGCTGTSAGSVTITVMGPNPGCTSSMTDYRDNPPTNYKTALINGKCWMLENLRYGSKVVDPSPLQPKEQSDNCINEKYCLSTDNANCSQNGGFYQWDELIRYGQTPASSQGLCPPGWHVPSEQEWQDLMNSEAKATPGHGMAGDYLEPPYRFNALTSGIYYLNNTWAYDAGTVTGTMFWTSTFAGNKPIARGINNLNPSVSLYQSTKANAFPVRCLKD